MPARATDHRPVRAGPTRPMVPSVGPVTRRASPPSAPIHESDLAAPVRRHLEGEGYTVWVDPDGTDFFDVVARLGDVVGLVELKISDTRKVLGQAVRRRGYADWVAVALPRESTARRVLTRPIPSPGDRVGVWWVDGGSVKVLRAATMRPRGDNDPFAERRRGLFELLDLLELGRLPTGVRWSHITSGRARPPREIRLDEFPEPEKLGPE